MIAVTTELAEASGAAPARWVSRVESAGVEHSVTTYVLPGEDGREVATRHSVELAALVARITRELMDLDGDGRSS